MISSKHIPLEIARIAKNCGGTDTTARYQRQRRDCLLTIDCGQGEELQTIAFHSDGEAIAARSIIELYLEEHFRPAQPAIQEDFAGDLSPTDSDLTQASFSFASTTSETSPTDPPATLPKPTMTIVRPLTQLSPDLFFDLGIDITTYTPPEALRLPSREKLDPKNLEHDTNPIAALRVIESQIVSALRRLPYSDYSSERSNTWSFVKSAPSANEDFVHISMATNPPLLRVVFDNGNKAHDKFQEALNSILDEALQRKAASGLAIDLLDSGPRKIFEIGFRGREESAKRTNRRARNGARLGQGPEPSETAELIDA